MTLSSVPFVGSVAARFPGTMGEQLEEASLLSLVGISHLFQADNRQTGSRGVPVSVRKGSGAGGRWGLLAAPGACSDALGAFSGPHSACLGAFSCGEPGCRGWRASDAWPSVSLKL